MKQKNIFKTIVNSKQEIRFSLQKNLKITKKNIRNKTIHDCGIGRFNLEKSALLNSYYNTLITVFCLITNKKYTTVITTI